MSYNRCMTSNLFRKIFFIIAMTLCFSFVFGQTSSISSASEARNSMVTYSKQFVGVPYILGGITKDGFPSL